jgi:hypothetical protein
VYHRVDHTVALVVFGAIAAAGILGSIVMRR